MPCCLQQTGGQGGTAPQLLPLGLALGWLVEALRLRQ